MIKTISRQTNIHLLESKKLRISTKLSMILMLTPTVTLLLSTAKSNAMPCSVNTYGIYLLSPSVLPLEVTNCDLKWKYLDSLLYLCFTIGFLLISSYSRQGNVNTIFISLFYSLLSIPHSMMFF